MADHGKNRRRSHFARKRQRQGKHKAMIKKKNKTERLKAWFDYWHNNGTRPKDTP